MLIVVIPGKPLITGVPQGAVASDTRAELICRSRGNSPYTKLIWFRDGREVDRSFAVVGDFIENKYSFRVTMNNAAGLECRLLFSATDYEASTFASINVQGEATAHCTVVD